MTAPAPSTGFFSLPCRESCCVVLDGRGMGGPGSPATMLFNLWMSATQEAVAFQPDLPPEMSIISLHDGYYVSRLALGRHSPAALRQAMDRLEQECVLGPMGLTSNWGASGSPLLPELAVEARHGHPLRGTAAENTTRTSSERLFAIGEDSALAALRSALAGVAQDSTLFAPRIARSLGEVEKHEQNTLFSLSVVEVSIESEWACQCVNLQRIERKPTQVFRSPDAHVRPIYCPPDVMTIEERTAFLDAILGRLLPVAADVSRCVPPGVKLQVLAVEAGPWDAEQQAAKARLLEMELRSGGCQAVAVRALPLTAACIARQVRAPLDLFLPLTLLLPPASAVRELQLLASPAILLAGCWRRGPAAATAGGRGLCRLEVLGRVPSSGVSSELLCGVPLLLRSLGSESVASLRALVQQLAAQQVALLLASNLCPVSLVPTACQHFFVGLASDQGDCGSGPVLVLHGLASADTWQSAASLVDEVRCTRPSQEEAQAGA
ncbi:unnamed protein product [Polarella glacialis]|uniref:Uncharacterized protein n=1 Tax=Polarella glacialis TaxID=89957 RepID=A0A813GSW5_POLGL|nr:unnamed protein product [Polarella glacialis]